MSNIKISGVNQSKFVNMTKEALSLSHGSPIGDKVVNKFIVNLFKLKNEHSLTNIFTKQKNVLIEDSTPENSTFEINEKRAVFEYHLDGTLKLSQIHVCYNIVGFWDRRKVSISEGAIDPNSGYVVDMFPNYTDYKNGRDACSSTDQEAAVNLHTASNHAFELSTWLNTVKQSLEPNDLKADGWNVKIFGMGVSCTEDPRQVIEDIKTRANPNNISEHTDIELILLQLAGVDTDNGYFHDDVVYAVEKTRPIFGNKFDPLLRFK
jgi:hypothetical protein